MPAAFSVEHSSVSWPLQCIPSLGTHCNGLLSVLRSAEAHLASASYQVGARLMHVTCHLTSPRCGHRVPEIRHTRNYKRCMDALTRHLWRPLASSVAYTGMLWNLRQPTLNVRGSLVFSSFPNHRWRFSRSCRKPRPSSTADRPPTSSGCAGSQCCSSSQGTPARHALHEVFQLRLSSRCRLRCSCRKPQPSSAANGPPTRSGWGPQLTKIHPYEPFCLILHAQYPGPV